MSFLKCKAPKRRELAVRAPWGDFHGYEHELDRQHRYWSGQQVDAREEVKLTEYDLAHTMHKELWQVTAGRTRDELGFLFGSRGEHFRERDRRRGLGAIAMSLLLQELIRPGAVLEDARDVGYATMLVDMMAGRDDMPLDHRLHVQPADASSILPASDADNQWYRQGSLYIQRVRPAELSDPMVDFIEEKGIVVDPADFVTLYPYLKSRS